MLHLLNPGRCCISAVLQNETHPYHQSKEMQEHITEYGIVLESWFPIGGHGYKQALFSDSTISSIASAHGKTAAQIILRWRLQAGNIVQYDTIILAYPNYWRPMPMAVCTFLEAFDFTGKTILPLCPNEGSGMGIGDRDLQAMGLRGEKASA